MLPFQCSSVTLSMDNVCTLHDEPIEPMGHAKAVPDSQTAYAQRLCLQSNVSCSVFVASLVDQRTVNFVNQSRLDSLDACVDWCLALDGCKGIIFDTNLPKRGNNCWVYQSETVATGTPLSIQSNFLAVNNRCAKSAENVKRSVADLTRKFQVTQDRRVAFITVPSVKPVDPSFNVFYPASDKNYGICNELCANVGVSASCF